jgi:low affinity Fe/Cu permease
MKKVKKFEKLARNTTRWTGHPMAFVSSAVIVLMWAVAGPIFGYSDTWQLAINTATTIVTFMMVFLIQNSQNRDTKALQIKLDELIRNTKGAHNTLLDLEELAEDDLSKINDEYKQLAKISRQKLSKGISDSNRPKVKVKK